MSSWGKILSDTSVSPVNEDPSSDTQQMFDGWQRTQVIAGRCPSQLATGFPLKVTGFGAWVQHILAETVLISHPTQRSSFKPYYPTKGKFAFGSEAPPGPNRDEDQNWPSPLIETVPLEIRAATQGSWRVERGRVQSRKAVSKLWGWCLRLINNFPFLLSSSLLSRLRVTSISHTMREHLLVL